MMAPSIAFIAIITTLVSSSVSAASIPKHCTQDPHFAYTSGMASKAVGGMGISGRTGNYRIVMTGMEKSRWRDQANGMSVVRTTFRLPNARAKQSSSSCTGALQD